MITAPISALALTFIGAILIGMMLGWIMGQNDVNSLKKAWIEARKAANEVEERYKKRIEWFDENFPESRANE